MPVSYTHLDVYKRQRVVCAVFLCALLDFAGLAALLPVLFFLLDDGRDKDAALLFLSLIHIYGENADATE